MPSFLMICNLRMRAALWLPAYWVCTRRLVWLIARLRPSVNVDALVDRLVAFGTKYGVRVTSTGPHPGTSID